MGLGTRPLDEQPGLTHGHFDFPRSDATLFHHAVRVNTDDELTFVNQTQDRFGEAGHPATDR
jgi:hypothetical protein